MIADLHAGGPDMPLPHIRRVVDTAQALRSDLVVLLGDFKAWYRWFEFKPVADPLWAAELARLKAPLGIWAILGNHDWWHDLAGVRAALAGAHIPVLENDAVLLGAAGQRFWLAGLGDQIAHRLGDGRFRGVDDLPGTLARIQSDDPVLLLVHEPDIFPQIPDRVALTLAGHTHGGQIRLPLVWPNFVPSKYGARFAYGHVIEDDRHLIVSGGLGTSIDSGPFRSAAGNRARHARSMKANGADQGRRRIHFGYSGCLIRFRCRSVGAGRDLRAVRRIALLRRQHHDDGADLHAAVEVDRVFVGHADAA